MVKIHIHYYEINEKDITAIEVAIKDQDVNILAQYSNFDRADYDKGDV